MFGRMLFQALLIYIGYRFIFNFVVPVVRTTFKLRSQAKKFQDHVRQNAQQPEEQKRPQPQSQFNKKVDKGDYIDFEEVDD